MGSRYSRRRVLATTVSLASVGTLAGCSGNGDSGGDGTDEESEDSTGGDETSTAPTTESNDGGTGAGMDGDADPTETVTAADDGAGSDGTQQLCADLTATEYERYDESGSPFVATFEYPSNGDGSAVGATAVAGEEYSLSLQKELGDGDSFYIFAVQYTNGTDATTAVQRGEGGGLEQVGTLEFGGESVPVIRAEPEATGDSRNRFYNKEPYYILGLPHEATGEKQYYRFDLRATTAFANGIDTNDCQESWEEVATHMVNSLKVNADTTVESAGE